MRGGLLSLSLLVLVHAAPVSGAVVFTDGFDAENGGLSQLNYNAFANWTVSAGSGTVDLIRSGDFGISCFGGTGSCVDLDGSSSNAGILTSTNIAFSSGDLVEISFRLSGNQRNASADQVGVQFNFGQLTDVLSLTKTGDFGLFGPSNFSGISGASDNLAVLGNDPFGVYNLSFTSLTTGFLFLTFANAFGDNVGAILDAVTVSAGPQAVPEPSTWALLIASLALAGFAMRRGRAAAPAVSAAR
jgi:hypothetical protein